MSCARWSDPGSYLEIHARHDTVNGADALTVFPANMHLAVCVRVPGVVVDTVPKY